MGIFLPVAMLAGCGDDSPAKVTKRPSVTQAYPGDGSTDVNLNPVVQVWFDETLDEASVNPANVFVQGAVTHRVEYDSDQNLVSLHLTNILEPDSTYEVTVGSDIKNINGHSMLADFTFSFTTGALDCAHLEDCMEPNDQVGSAAAVELDKTYTCLSTCGGDGRYDYYRFTLESAAMVRAKTTLTYLDTTEVSWAIYFLRDQDSRYCWYLGPISAGGEQSYRYTFLPGTYYLEVRKIHDDKYLAVYDLVLETSAPCEDDSYEDNDFWDEAVPVTPGTISDLRGCDVDPDWFSIDLTAGQTLVVTATQTTDFETTRELIIYDPDIKTVADTLFEAEGVPTTRSWVAIGDGIHYFSIRWWVDGLIYDLDVDVNG
jgi:hypothetical protein